VSVHSKRFGRTQLLSERACHDPAYLVGACERITEELFTAALADGYVPLEEPTIVVTREAWPPEPERPWWMRALAALGWAHSPFPRPSPSVIIRCECVCDPIDRIEWQ
jgi:hypothetical protein